MSILGRRIPLGVLAAIVAVLVCAGALVPAWSRTPAREIRLVAEDMTFYVEGNPTANPVLEVRAGETIRIRFRNNDRGMTHDFAVPAFKAAMDPLKWDNEETLVFTAPGKPGTYEYVCRPHLLMMKGTLRVK